MVRSIRLVVAACLVVLYAVFTAPAVAQELWPPQVEGGIRVAEHDFGGRVRLGSLSVDADLPTGTSIVAKLYGKDSGQTDWQLIQVYTFTAAATVYTLPANTYAEKVKYGLEGTDGIVLRALEGGRLPVLRAITLTVTADPTPVLLIHGFRSAAANDWGFGGGLDFKAGLEARGFTVETMELLPKPANGNITDYAGQLLSRLNQLRVQYGVRKVDIVAHSMGGLVAREYARRFPGRGEIRNLVMLGTPNLGSELLYPQYRWLLCRLAGTVFGDISGIVCDIAAELLVGQAGYQMTPGSGFLTRLNTASRSGIERYIAIAGTRGIPLTSLLLTGPDDGVVRQYSVSLGGAFLTHPYAVNHFGLHESGDILDEVVAILSGDSPSAGTSLRTPLSVDELITPTQQSPLISGTIFSAQEFTHTVAIDGYTWGASFALGWQSGTLSFTLRSPSGALIDPAVAAADPNIDYSEDFSSTFTVYSVLNPDPGQWIEHVTAVDVPTTGTQYNTMAFFDTSLMLRTGIITELQRAGQTAVITASVVLTATPVVGAAVTATVQRPDGVTDGLILYDDGSHGDAQAADGTYTAVYTNTSSLGAYDVLVLATGTVGGQSFARYGGLTFAVEEVGTLRGEVRLQGQSNSGEVVVALGDLRAGPTVSGALTMEQIPSGTYVVTATMPGYLNAQRTGVVVSAGMTTMLPTATLLGGDASGDNAIDIYDLTLLGAAFGSPSATGDITGDGAVNIFDLALVGANFGRSAPTEW